MTPSIAPPPTDAGLDRLDLGWRLPGVRVAAIALPAEEEQLRAVAGPSTPPPRAVAKRRLEFFAGRAAAALALRELGALSFGVGRNEDRSPCWPAGFVGAISHCEGLAAAAVARARDHRGIGFDVEGIVEPETSSALATRVLNGAEAGRLARAGFPANVGFSLAFSAKEAAYKFLYPLTHEFLDFGDLRVSEVSYGGAEGALWLELLRGLGAAYPRGSVLPARFRLDRKRVQTLVAPAKDES